MKCFNHGASTCWLRTEKLHQESEISGLPSPGPFMTTCSGRSGIVVPWPSLDPSVPSLHLTAYFCRKSCPNGESPLVPKASHILILREAQHTCVNAHTHSLTLGPHVPMNTLVYAHMGTHKHTYSQIGMLRTQWKVGWNNAYTLRLLNQVAWVLIPFPPLTMICMNLYMLFNPFMPQFSHL